MGVGVVCVCVGGCAGCVGGVHVCGVCVWGGEWGCVFVGWELGKD